MKILIMSDSHGNKEAVNKAIAKESPDKIIHLGDGWRDLPSSIDIPCYRVIGNCDDPACGFPEKKVIELDSLRILITHGHLYRVKFSLIHLKLAAMEANAHLALFGHTHSAFEDKTEDGVFLFNPGTIGKSVGSYGILETNGKDFTLRHIFLDRL